MTVSIPADDDHTSVTVRRTEHGVSVALVDSFDGTRDRVALRNPDALALAAALTDAAGAPVLWELHYERQLEGEDPSDFERTVWGPPPIAGMTYGRDTVPADVRHWAQMNGAACHADAVAYRLAVLVDVTGYTEPGAAAVLPSVHTICAEEIRP